jgi:4'-phosphopantetheinyl transferase
MDVPADDTWLSQRERNVLAQLRFEVRSRDWRLGRWTAKLAVAGWMDAAGLAVVDLTECEVLAANDGAPEGFVRREPAPCSVSLSHRDGRALAVVAPASARLGCDLELVEPRAPVFAADYFTERERAVVAEAAAGELDLIVTLIWAAKEAALKAMRCGLRADTRWVEVELRRGAAASEGWEQLVVRSVRDHRAFGGWWRHGDGLIRTIVTEAASAAPTALAAG